MKRTARIRTKVATMLAVTLGGGTMFGGCETRLKEALVAGTKDYFLNDFLASLATQVAAATEDATETDS